MANPRSRTSGIVSRIEVPQPGRMQLEVFNIAGQKVRTLIDETKLPGSYSVTWDGRDEYGEAVSSGVYLYRLKVGEAVETKKMVLLK